MLAFKRASSRGTTPEAIHLRSVLITTKQYTGQLRSSLGDHFIDQSFAALGRAIEGSTWVGSLDYTPLKLVAVQYGRIHIGVVNAFQARCITG